MDYIQLLQKNLQSLSEGKISDLLFDEIFNLDEEIIKLQSEQIEQSKGYNGKDLYNPNYASGTYSENTQWYADNNNPYPSLTRKPKDKKYNFIWGGEFVEGFGLRKEGDGVEIYSEGAYSTRTLGKTGFFQGYTNMFGLDEKNTATIESEVLYFVLEKVILKIYG
jgi:hypothetical protein